MKKVVIVGAGFGGLMAAKDLAHLPVSVMVIDRSNHHLFQPLLYQVATAGLSPADIAVPIRHVLRNQSNTEVRMGEVVGIDRTRRSVRLQEGSISYDYLVVATGAAYHYFGHPEWERYAPSLQSIQNATEIRSRILLAFEAAEGETDVVKQSAYLSFVIVGAGPTGVELAGAIADLSRKALASDFRRIHPDAAKIYLLEAGPRILATFPESLSEAAGEALRRLGVEVRTSAKVELIDLAGVVASGQRISSACVLWAAGVKASPVGDWLGAVVDRSGRVLVEKDLSLPGQPEIFVIGDTAAVEQDGRPLPGVAPVAMQQGRYVAEAIRSRLKGEVPKPFRYRDKGNLATVGRSFAVADVRGLHLSGLVAWLLWLVVHIFYLIGFRNRLLVMIQWAWAYVTFQRGARLITGGRDRSPTGP